VVREQGTSIDAEWSETQPSIEQPSEWSKGLIFEWGIATDFKVLRLELQEEAFNASGGIRKLRLKQPLLRTHRTVVRLNPNRTSSVRKKRKKKEVFGV
jgi:hypothetical protein